MGPLWSETCWSNFRYFIILIVSIYHILCIGWIMKCSIITVARCGHEEAWSSSGASALTRQFRGLRRHYSVWKCTRIQHHNRHTGTTSMPVRLQYEPFAKQFTWSWRRKNQHSPYHSSEHNWYFLTTGENWKKKGKKNVFQSPMLPFYDPQICHGQGTNLAPRNFNAHRMIREMNIRKYWMKIQEKGHVSNFQYYYYIYTHTCNPKALLLK